jgi:hypothetical protein
MRQSISASTDIHPRRFLLSLCFVRWFVTFLNMRVDESDQGPREPESSGPTITSNSCLDPQTAGHEPNRGFHAYGGVVEETVSSH